MPRFRICFLFLFIVPFIKTSGQVGTDPVRWKKIDSAIWAGKNLQDIQTKILDIKARSIVDHNDAILARCFAGLLLIKDRKTEDSLFFKNAGFIDSILISPSSSALLKSIMHLLLARRISEFETRFEYRANKHLIRTGIPAKEYALMDRKELDSLIAEHLDESIRLSKQVQGTDLDELLWLSSDPLMFLFKPDYTDLLYGERIFMFRNHTGYHSAKSASEWLAESQDAFIQTGDKIKTFDKEEQVLFGYYHDWIQYKFSANPAAAYFIETLARKRLYRNLTEDSAGAAAYEKYLNTLLLSSYNAVAAHAVFQLCKIWNSEAGKYNSTLSSHTSYYGKSLPAFDSSYRWYYDKTLQLLSQYEKKLDSFFYLRADLMDMKSNMLALELKVMTRDVQLPDSAFPALLQYRNVSHLYTRVVKISALDILYGDKISNLRRFMRMPVFAEKIHALILPDDHQWHNSFVKFDPLPAGRYIMLYSDTVISNDTARINYIDLTISNIAVINNDERVFVLNRKTGFPIKGATVLVTVRQKIKSGTNETPVIKTLSPRIVNDLGYILVGEKEISHVIVWIGSDSIRSMINKPENNFASELYNKETDGGLAEYYENNIRLNIFTDRAIYRPGQMVFFKGIFTVSNPKTGELMLLDFQNLKFPFFENLVYKTVLKFKKPKTDVTISDPFNRTMDSFRVTPNKFGSFSGSYLIPKDAATGEWDFDAKHYEMGNQNSGKFRVEEYKRPSFKLILAKPKTELQLGDSFNILVKTRSFAGAPLSHVRLSYQVSHRGHNDLLKSKEFLTGESFSNEMGEFKLLVYDSSLQSIVFPRDKESSIEYYVNVEALDETGESHEEELNLSLSNHPVNISFPIPDMVERNSMAPIYISMTNSFSGPVKKPVDIYIYKLSQAAKSDNDWNWPPADVWINPPEAWQKEFPDMNFKRSFEEEIGKDLVYKTSFPIESDKKFKLPAQLAASGLYEIEVVCEVDGMIKGKTTRRFSLYNIKENSFPGNDFEWLPYNSAFSDDTLKLTSGNKENNYFSIYHISYNATDKNGVSKKFEYTARKDQQGLNEFNFRVPSGIMGNLQLTHLYILHNQLYKRQHSIIILNKKDPGPDIVIEKFRTQISPGEKETFTVSIKTKNSRELAELMTTMYDASMDELEPHNWAIPVNNIYYYNSGGSWNRSITEFQNSYLYDMSSRPYPILKKDIPLWWMSSTDLLSDYIINHDDRGDFNDADGSKLLQGSVSGLNIQSPTLQDMVFSGDLVVEGYQTTKRSVTGAITTVRIRGVNSISNYVQPMIILDGVPYTGDINKITPESITNAIVLKGADATAIYGSRAAAGVLILSTHGPIVLPPAPEMPMPPLLMRKNFAESAFFYPMIYAGKDGMYSISFTLPESVTEWRWKLFAHTRKAGFAYLEKSLFSQLPLMVQPSMPRFLYQGDKIFLKTRITNLDTDDKTGQLSCTVEDLVTGENLSSNLLKEITHSFSVKHQSNTAGDFMLSIPPGLLHPLRIRITGTTKTFSDGEEHVIPVLSRKFLVSQTKSVKAQIAHPFQLATPAFPADAELYGLSLIISPKPQATLMNALSDLAFDPYECSEQTLNKMLAFAMAIHIARKDITMREGISKIPYLENTATYSKNDLEPDEQTMPWLQLRHSSVVQQQKLRQLFDTARSKQAFEKKLTELMAMQNADGGLSWFKGGKTNDFISGYVLSGLGKMEQDKLLDPELLKLIDKYTKFLNRLINYVDSQLVIAIKDNDAINALYARSYWLKDHPVALSVRSVADSVLKTYWNNISNFNIDQQATLIIISLRFAKEDGPLRDQSLRQLESIRQLAISDSSNGVRWKAISNSDDLNRQDEETVARIAEAFETAGKSEDILRGIVKWLLKTRNEHVWATTKSTAAVVGLLKPPDLPGGSYQLSAKTGDSILTVSDDLFGGKSADFLDLSGNKFPDSISISSASSASVSGSIKYYYFSSTPTVDSLNTLVKIQKTLFRYDAQSGAWQPIKENTDLRIADKIKTVLTITTAKQLNYIFINERRAAAMEPQETESGYKYEGGLEYYQSIKDAAYLFFIDKIPSGIHHISYETILTASGNFTNGPASLQCMYQPSVNAYSNSSNMIVVP